MSTISIIGAGSFGTALAITLSVKHTITLIDTKTEIVNEINKNHTNSSYTGYIKLDENVRATTALSTTSQSDIIIVAVPSYAMSIVAKQLSQYNINKAIIISATKGLAGDGRSMTSILEENLPITSHRIFAMSGASIAKELAQGANTDMVIGGDKRIGQKLVKQLSTDTMNLRLSNDKFGIQLLGFYKNIIAIMVGICEGLHMSTNTTSALVTAAYSELYRKNIKRMHRHTFVTHAGLGDLLVTMYSQNSRNHRFGKEIASGKNVSEALALTGQVVEGLNAIRILAHLDNDTYFDIDLITALNSIFRTRKKENKKRILKIYLRSKS